MRLYPCPHPDVRTTREQAHHEPNAGPERATVGQTKSTPDRAWAIRGQRGPSLAHLEPRGGHTTGARGTVADAGWRSPVHRHARHRMRGARLGARTCACGGCADPTRVDGMVSPAFGPSHTLMTPFPQSTRSGAMFVSFAR